MCKQVAETKSIRANQVNSETRFIVLQYVKLCLRVAKASLVVMVASVCS